MSPTASTTYQGSCGVVVSPDRSTCVSILLVAVVTLDPGAFTLSATTAYPNDTGPFGSTASDVHWFVQVLQVLPQLLLNAPGVAAGYMFGTSSVPETLRYPPVSALKVSSACRMFWI